jgi:hypothetical protein
MNISRKKKSNLNFENCFTPSQKQKKQLEGYLYKQGVGIGLGKGFKKRFFAQKGARVNYYKSKSDNTEIGYINLNNALVCAKSDSKDSKFHFRVSFVFDTFLAFKRS